MSAPQIPQKTQAVPPQPTSQKTVEGELTLKLLAYEYDEKNGLVLWKVHNLTPGTDPERSVMVLAYPIMDLLRLYGVNTKLEKSHILKWFSDMQARPWPFKMRMTSTATLIEADKIKELATADWKEELGRVKKPEDLHKLDSTRINANTEQFLKAHSVLDQYPYHELLKRIEAGTL